MPNFLTFSKIARSSTDNSPGFDGLPYSAHNTYSGLSCVLMESVFIDMKKTCTPGHLIHDFNNLMQCCIPKKSFFPYMHGVACRSNETRSLSCKNSDNKMICKAVAHALMPVVQSFASSPQRGFITHRHFADNIVLVDTISRIYSNCHNAYGNAVMAFFDFSNAFPSLSLRWLCIG